MSEPSIVASACECPALWIERVVIYRSHAKGEVIRDIRFTRGLNIIWGSPGTTDGNANPEEPHLGGHSVGKTSLCRLIRYALDEDSYGQKEASERIRECFPDGAVGVTLHLKDVCWSVLRKFRDQDSRAAQGVDIERLSSMEARDCTYAAYARSLRTSFTSDLPGYRDGYGIRCTWRDLLAWMTRDQEARYQSLWNWRDYRSNAQRQTLGKDDSLKLMRSVMGIYSEAEESLLRQIGKLNEDRENTKRLRDKRELARQARDAYLDEVLKRILGISDSGTASVGDLFGVNSESDAWVIESENHLQQLRRNRAQVQQELAGLRAKEQSANEKVTLIHSHLVTLRDGTEPGPSDQQLRLLEARLDKDCTLGEVPFAECKHFMQRLEKLRSPFADISRKLRDDRAADKTEELKQAERSWVAEQMLLSAELADLRQRIAGLQNQDHELEGRIVQVASDIQRVQSYRTDKLAVSSDPSFSVSELDNRVTELQHDIRLVENTLGNERMKHKETCEQFEDLFNRLIQNLFSDRYTGRIVFPPVGRLDFRIAGMSGEAIQTFTCLLADITAMLWSVAGNGYHPRFLIHDSPREADLSGRAYASFLSSMNSVSQSLGGENAPFQYIVTTTTSPPQDVIEAGCVRLTLSSTPTSEMLFRDNIELTLEGMDTRA